MLIVRRYHIVFWIVAMVKTEKCTRHDYAALAARSVTRRQEISNNFARDIAQAIDLARSSGADDLNAIANHLNEAGLKTLRGRLWRGNQVKRQLDRLANGAIANPYKSIKEG